MYHTLDFFNNNIFNVWYLDTLSYFDNIEYMPGFREIYFSLFYTYMIYTVVIFKIIKLSPATERKKNSLFCSQIQFLAPTISF